MPLPTRRKNETRDKFISRCMADAVMVREYPDAAQRRAICEKQIDADAGEGTANSGIIQAAAIGLEWIEAAGDEKQRRFRIRAYSGGAMRVSNYGPPIAIELSGLQANTPIPILLDHDSEQIVGHSDDVMIGDTKLSLEGRVSGIGEAADKVTAMASNGFPWRASVGVLPDELEYVGENQTTKVNGKTLKGPLYVARTSELKEVSFVAVAADTRTSAKLAASSPTTKELNMPKTFDEWVKAEFGLDAETLTDEQRPKFEAKFKAKDEPPKTEPKPEPKSEPKAETGSEPKPELQAASTQLDFAARREQEAAEVERAQAIRTMCAKYRSEVGDEKTAEIEAAGIRDGSDVRDVHLKLLIESRPKAPPIHSSTRDVSMPAIEAAFCRTIGLGDMEKHFKPEVLEASDRYPNLGLQEMLLICASQNGYGGRFRIGNDNLRDVLKAAFSTHTVTTMLTTSGNKMLLDGFNRVSQTWREVAATRNVSDFKAVTAFRMTASMEYVELPPGGEIEHGEVGQESYTVQAKTYAKMFSLTRTDIINDDLGAFDDLRNRIGMGAAIAMNKVFWTAWLAAVDGAAFWTAARGNYQSGAATALGETALNTAVKRFRDATGPDGNLIELEPERLLVPSDLEATARKLYTSQEVRDTTASTKTMVNNIYFNRFRPIVVPQLSNSSYTGFSATGWFLLAAPAMLASAVMAFLNGVQTPTIESTDADFNTLGIQSRGYHDFGVSMTEYRASVHSAGA